MATMPTALAIGARKVDLAAPLKASLDDVGEVGDSAGVDEETGALPAGEAGLAAAGLVAAGLTAALTAGLAAGLAAAGDCVLLLSAPGA